MESFEGKYATLTYLRSLPRDKPGFFETIWLVRSISTKTSRTGSEYLSVELGDYTGSFVFTCFNDTPLQCGFESGGGGHRDPGKGTDRILRGPILPQDQ